MTGSTKGALRASRRAPRADAGAGTHRQWVERALGRERRRARAGHWAYSLNRHLALREELDRLDGTRRASRRIGRTHRTGDASRTDATAPRRRAD